MARIKKTKKSKAPPKKIQMQEVLKCGTDARYFINNYVKISHPMKGVINFDTFPFQDECLEIFQSNRFAIVNKSRQLGLSTVSAAYSLWMGIFRKQKFIGVIATKLKTAQLFIRKVRDMYMSLPGWLVMPSVTGDSKSHLEFSNGSRIEASATSVDAFRGAALSLLIVDEAAHVEGIEELWLALWPTLSTGGSAILISTPAGVGSFFHKMWKAANDGDNDFIPIELPWDVHPERDEEWYIKERRQLIEARGERGVAQELLCLTANTNIVTIDGCKKIKNIKPGDLVLTHKGRYKPVVKTYKHQLQPNESLLAVSTPGNRKQPIFITSNHPILSYQFKPKKGENYKQCFRKHISEGLKPNFNSLSDISRWKFETNSTRRVVYGCLFPHLNLETLSSHSTKNLLQIDLGNIGVGCSELGESTVRYHRQNRSIKTKRFVDVNFDLGRLVGLYAAEGHSESNRIRFAFHTQEMDTLGSFVRNYLNDQGFKFYDNNRNYSKCYTILSTNKFLRKLLNSFVIPGSARTKYYNLPRVLQTNKDFIRGLLVGHFEGDGDHPFNKPLENKLKVVSKSTKMLYQLKTLMSLYGLYPRLGFLQNEPSYLEIDGLRNFEPSKRNIRNLTRQKYTKHLLEKQTSRTVLVDDKYFTGAIQWNEVSLEAHYGEVPPIVYNIEVGEDNSYIADSLVVHNCSFASSGDTYLNVDVMDMIHQRIKKPIAFWGPDWSPKKDMWIWEHPKTDHKYVIAADVARGDGADFSAFHVIDIEDDEVVAEYKGKMPPDKFGDLLATAGLRYNVAMICPERNSVGLPACLKLKEMNYPNLYYAKLQKNIYMAYSTMDLKDEIPGFETTEKSKQEILARLEDVLRNKRLAVYSERFHAELQTFVWKKNNKLSAQKGYNDDLIMALAIGNSLFEAGGASSYSSDEIAKAMIAGMSVSTKVFNAVDNPDPTQQNAAPPIMTDGSLSDFLDKNRAMNSKAASGTHNYNDPFWKQFSWIWD